MTDGTGSCDAFGVYGDLGSSFIAPSACPMSIQAYAFDPAGAERLLDDNRPAGDHDQPGVDRERRRERQRLSHRPGVGDFWRDVNTGAWGGSTLAPGQQWFNTSLEGSANINSQIYGIQLVCTAERPSAAAPTRRSPSFTVSGIELQGTENSAPYVTGQGALWSSGSYVWNPPGDSFPVTLYCQRRLRHLLLGRRGGKQWRAERSLRAA